jgi:hypothetical protein
MQLLSNENDQLVSKIEQIEIERDNLRDEVKSQHQVLLEISEARPMFEIERPDFLPQLEQDKEMTLKSSGFSIVPSRFISVLISLKHQQLKSNSLLKAKAVTENKLLDEIRMKNVENQNLKTQLKSSQQQVDSITLNINQSSYLCITVLAEKLDFTIDDEIKEKLNQLENENLELRKQMNTNICSTERSNYINPSESEFIAS